MLGSALLSGAMSLWNKSMENKKLEHERTMSALSKHGQMYQEARQATGPEYIQTRKIIALTVIFSAVLLPKLVAWISPEIAVHVGYTEWVSGFLFFTDDTQSVVWRSFTGLTITPLDTNMAAALAGFYFGHRVTKPH